MPPKGVEVSRSHIGNDAEMRSVAPRHFLEVRFEFLVESFDLGGIDLFLAIQLARWEALTEIQRRLRRHYFWRRFLFETAVSGTSAEAFL
jgi:hypothetical protein